MESKTYRIGLDVGIASVGFAVISNDVSGEPNEFLKLGVRCFDRAEVPKTGGSLAEERRMARGSRRGFRRRRHRLDRVKDFFEKSGLTSREELEFGFHSSQYDVYEIRNRALNERITNIELALVLYNIAKRRGFKSNRKAETTSKEGELLEATNSNNKLLKDKGYKTVGQMLYLDSKFREGDLLVVRNKGESYKNTLLRDLLEEEVREILRIQEELGNSLLTQDFVEKYIQLFLSQRPFDLGPGGDSPYGGDLIDKMLGRCTFYPELKRACKASHSVEEFILWQNINNLKLKVIGKGKISLTEEQKVKLEKLAFQKATLHYADIRKHLEIDENTYFDNVSYPYNQTREEAEKKRKFEYLKAYHQIRKVFDSLTAKGEYFNLDIGKKDKIGEILTLYKDDDRRRTELSSLNFHIDIIEGLLSLNFTKTANLSLKAIQEILPYLKEGLTYDKACEKAGLDFKADIKNHRVKKLHSQDILDEVQNPVVKRAVSQTIKVLNAIVAEFGAPETVHIELSREMSKSYKERKEIEKLQEKNRKENEERLVALLEEIGIKHPTGKDILKYRLWKEQDEHCIYSGRKITISDLRDDNMLDIDHIIPYSISFDDSISNKVLVFASENRQKGNRLPFQYLGGNKEKWNTLEKFAEDLKSKGQYRKYFNLLKRELTEEEMQEFKERNLNDTKYISRLLFNYIRNSLEFSTSGRKKRVYAVNGRVTAYIRKRWGLSKVREAGDKHHAVDASVVACVSDGMINRISNYMKKKEEGNKEKHFPVPFDTFTDELRILSNSENALSFERFEKKYGRKCYEERTPLFVSRMPNRKVTGQAHKETITSFSKNDESILIKKTLLGQLKLDKETGEILNYYNKEDDRLLYEALKTRLKEYKGDAEQAFKEPFYKPKTDGSRGPLVRSVKLIEKSTLNVDINGGKAANGAMVRVDVFRVDDKYYLVPIYVSDTVKEKLPSKAIVANKGYADWEVMEDKNFIFSLFPRDLVKIKSKNGWEVTLPNGEKKILNEEYMYYNKTGISTASVSLFSHDKSFEIPSVGVKTLLCFEKYKVDVLGNITKVKKEKRLPFNINKK